MNQVKVKIKQVPDDSPNHDGEWVAKEIPHKLYTEKGIKLWDGLDKHCDEGYHAVAMEKAKEDE